MVRHDPDGLMLALLRPKALGGTSASMTRMGERPFPRHGAEGGQDGLPRGPEPFVCA